jgi:hypothetical protein
MNAQADWRAHFNTTVFGVAHAWLRRSLPGTRITNIPSGRSTDTNLESWCAGFARYAA